jgi:hypothetical protein
MTPGERLLSVLAIVAAFAAFAYVGSRRAQTEATRPSSSIQETPPILALPEGVPLVVKASRTEPTGCQIDGADLERVFEVAEEGDHKRFFPRALTTANRVRVILHLHGGVAAAKVLATEDVAAVVITVDRGTGSKAYEDMFARENALGDLIAFGLRRPNAPPAEMSSLVLTAWSAGYGGVRDFLKRGLDRDPALAGIVLLDGLHASYEVGTHSPEPAALAPFVTFGRRALLGQAGFFISHTAIVPPDYASTTETSDYLLKTLSVPNTKVGAGGLAGLTLTRVADQNGLHVRGFEGRDADAHCNQLRLLPTLAKDAFESKR